jgi:hypothetical protein
MARKLRCYLGRHHWQKKRDDEGAIYSECRDCGKLRETYEPPAESGFIIP